MAMRGLIMVAAVMGVSMCATAPVAPTEDVTTGPDGLVLRNAPTDEVQADALPAPEVDAPDES